MTSRPLLIIPSIQLVLGLEKIGYILIFSNTDYDTSLLLSFSISVLLSFRIEEADKGSHPVKKVHFFLTLFKKPLTPPPHSFEHYVVNFSEGILTKVRKRLSRQLSKK
jgi:hypothetical protein